MKNLIEKNARVVYEKELECLHIQFSGFISSEDLVRVLGYEFIMVEYYKITKCIVDLSGMKVYPTGGKEYIKDVWFPRMESYGIKNIAVIVPENIFGEASMLKAHEQAKNHKKMQTRHFRNINNALKWLREAPVLADPVH